MGFGAGALFHRRNIAIKTQLAKTTIMYLAEKTKRADEMVTPSVTTRKVLGSPEEMLPEIERLAILLREFRARTGHDGYGVYNGEVHADPELVKILEPHDHLLDILRLVALGNSEEAE